MRSQGILRVSPIGHVLFAYASGSDWYLPRATSIDYPGVIAIEHRGEAAMRTIAALFVVAVAASALHAQTTPPPTITSVMPTGGKPGTTFELTVSGAELDGVEGLHFSFPGAKVEVLSAEKATVDVKKKGGGKGGPRTITIQKFQVVLPADAARLPRPPRRRQGRH